MEPIHCSGYSVFELFQFLLNTWEGFIKTFTSMKASEEGDWVGVRDENEHLCIEKENVST